MRLIRSAVESGVRRKKAEQRTPTDALIGGEGYQEILPRQSSSDAWQHASRVYDQPRMTTRRERDKRVRDNTMEQVDRPKKGPLRRREMTSETMDRPVNLATWTV